MNTFDSAMTTTVSLALTAHTQAKRFRQHHRDPAKAKAVYLNTLAICAVNTYLERSGFEPDLRAGNSWDPAQQTLMDTADLLVSGYGRVECRPVLPNQTAMDVPPEVWDDRLCYIAVQLDETLRSATILGFVETVTAEQIPLSELQPEADLMAFILQGAIASEDVESDAGESVVGQSVGEQEEEQNEARSPLPSTIQLGQWVQNMVETGWQTIDQLIEMTTVSDTPQLAWGFRNESPSGFMTSERGEGDRYTALDLNPSGEQIPTIIRGKQLAFGAGHNAIEVALIVGIPSQIETEADVWVQVAPVRPTGQLPPDLILAVLDDQERSVMQAESRSTEAMQLRFEVGVGEEFSLKLSLQDNSILERFKL